MKNILFSILVYLICNQAYTQSFSITLVSRQQSEYVIVVADKADSLSHRAAKELQHYIHAVSGANLEIYHDRQAKKKHLLVGKELLYDYSSQDQLQTAKEDAFVMAITEDEIHLYGLTGKTDLYAAYTFIEEILGCRLLSVGEEYIPQSPDIQMSSMDKLYEPAFSFRRTLFPGNYDEKYRYWHKLENLDDWGLFVHTFQHLIPPEKYFEEHPEYFSLVGGRRLSDAQLCLSNPEVIQVLIENLASDMAKKPDKKYWSVSQNDCYNYCTCQGCNALYKKYGSYSGAYIHMANQIATAFPDKHISTLAYQFTRSAPRNIRPLPNVNVMFCSIECNRSMALAEDERSADFVREMEDWAKITDNIFVWDYVVQFKNYFCPFPNFHVLQPNIQFFRDNGVDLMFQQGSGRNWSDLSDLKQYLIAKLLWNPDLKVDDLLDDFLPKYYGPAHPHIHGYYDLTHKNLIAFQKNEFLNIYGFPSDYVDSYLSPALIQQYKELMDQAEAAVQAEPTFLQRVRRTRLPVDFAYMDIALNNDLLGLSFFNNNDGHRTVNPEMKAYLLRLQELAESTHTTQINERNFQVGQYVAYVLSKLERMEKVNLAKGKKIKLKSPASEKYPVGQEKSLTDGLMGDFDFNDNWLGYEGEDMVVNIDLESPVTIKKVSMHFLKSMDSWIFLPEEVVVEVSLDGKNFTRAGHMIGDQSDHSYLVKSIPFEISFPSQEIRYIRITAKSLINCPEWHRGYGSPCWIFVDEVIVE